MSVWEVPLLDASFESGGIGFAPQPCHVFFTKRIDKDVNDPVCAHSSMVKMEVEIPSSRDWLLQTSRVPLRRLVQTCFPDGGSRTRGIERISGGSRGGSC